MERGWDEVIEGGRWAIVDERSKRGKGGEEDLRCYLSALCLDSSSHGVEGFAGVSLYLACSEEYGQEG